MREVPNEALASQFEQLLDDADKDENDFQAVLRVIRAPDGACPPNAKRR